MPDAKSEREIQTKQLAPDPHPPLATLHVIAYLRWEREWFETFQSRRARLLDVISQLHDQMNQSPGKGSVPIKSFLLGGETVVLEDIADIRPDLVTLLVIFNAGGRLGVGPWYTQVDPALTSGESLIRSLLAARSTAGVYGLKMMSVAYMPHATVFPAQLPQVLRGFSIDAAVLQSLEKQDAHAPFRWDGPNGSGVLTFTHDLPPVWPREPEEVEDVNASLSAQRTNRRDGPFIWMFDASLSQKPLVARLADTQKLGIPVQQSDLKNYINTLRRSLPDSVRPSRAGELIVQYEDLGAIPFSGTLSSRMYLKQANARLQSLLTYTVEPMLAVALTHGEIEYPENLRALLANAWRLLLKNQSFTSLGGTGSDAVHRENEMRFQQVEDTGQRLITRAAESLPGTRYERINPPPTDKTFVYVWNGLNWPVQQVVEVDLILPPKRYPGLLKSHDGEDVLYSWQPHPSGEGGRLIFRADAPAVGYATYTLLLSEKPPDEKRTGTRSLPGRVIAKVSGETLTVTDGRLVWKRDEAVIEDLLNFFDGGDAGDAYDYSKPEPDVMVKADLINDVKIESTAVYERLVIKHRMRVAPKLREDRGRDRGLKLIQMTTTATMYDHQPGVFFRTTFENTAEDHRLRAHLRTNIKAGKILVDTPFGIAERDAVLKGKADASAYASHAQPIQTVARLSGDKDTLGLAVKGLPEVEMIDEDDQLTFALTLLRAVGRLSRDDLKSRPGLVAPSIPTPEGQSLREMVAEYALIDLPEQDRTAMLRAGVNLNVPLQAFQYEEAPPRSRRSYLSIISDRGTGADSDGAGVIMSAMKPPEKGPGWVVRLFNPWDRAVEVYVTPFKRPRKVYIVTMSEEPEGYIEPDANGWVALNVNPHEIVTLMLIFDVPPRQQ